MLVDIDQTGLDRMRAWAQQSPAGSASFNAPREKDIATYQRQQS